MYVCIHVSLTVAVVVAVAAIVIVAVSDFVVVTVVVVLVAEGRLTGASRGNCPKRSERLHFSLVQSRLL